MIHMIVAMNATRTIGHNMSIPFHNPEDLAHFKAKTLHHVCVMGRITYESIPVKLTNRIIWVLTSSKNYTPKHDNVVVFHDIKTLINTVLEYHEDVFICGGLQIYRLFFPYVSTLWLSRIDDDVDGDVKLDRFEDEMTLVNTIQYNTFVCEEYHK
jgi:dihydrofolate reductase